MSKDNFLQQFKKLKFIIGKGNFNTFTMQNRSR